MIVGSRRQANIFFYKDGVKLELFYAATGQRAGFSFIRAVTGWTGKPILVDHTGFLAYIRYIS